jgi:hypothetical protein
MRRGRKTDTADRWAQDNRLSRNPAAFAAVAGLVFAVIGLFVLFYYV